MRKWIVREARRFKASLVVTTVWTSIWVFFVFAIVTVGWIPFFHHYLEPSTPIPFYVVAVFCIIIGVLFGTLGGVLFALILGLFGMLGQLHNSIERKMQLSGAVAGTLVATWMTVRSRLSPTPPNVVSNIVTVIVFGVLGWLSAVLMVRLLRRSASEPPTSEELDNQSRPRLGIAAAAFEELEREILRKEQGVRVADHQRR